LLTFFASASRGDERRFSYVGSRYAQLAQAFRFGKDAVRKFLIVTELGEEDERYFFRAHVDLADGGNGSIKSGRVFL
jgi:hypothetical protein